MNYPVQRKRRPIDRLCAVIYGVRMGWAKYPAILVCALWASSAFADVTVCNGNDCTIVSGETVRKMTPEEVAKKYRDDSKDALLRVDCYLADDENFCREL